MVLQRLKERVLSVVEFLLPAGKKENDKWLVVCDNQHMVISLKGDDVGIWYNEKDERQGDLIHLWQMIKKIDYVSAYRQIKTWLGEDESKLMQTTSFMFPVIDLSACQKMQGDIANHFFELTKIDKNIGEQFDLRQQGEQFVFPYWKNKAVRQVHKKLHVGSLKLISEEWVANKQTSLFGWQAFSTSSRTLALTLNEIDAILLTQYDIPSLALPTMDSHCAWLNYEYDDLCAFEKIYFVWSVTNENKKMTTELRTRLGAHRCYQVTLPAESVNHCLQKNITRDILHACFKEAKTVDPSELKPVSYFTNDMIHLINQTELKENGYRLPWQAVADKMVFRPNELSVWVGVNGHGKSQMLGYLMLQFMQQGAKVCIASLELTPQRLLLRLAKQFHGKEIQDVELIHSAQAWYQDRLWLFDLVGTAKTKQLLDVFEYARKRYGIDVFLIDSLMKCGIAEDDFNAQKLFIENLCDFKNSQPCHIHLVTHPRKLPDENTMPNKMDIKGSGAISDLADNVLAIWRNKKTPSPYNAELLCFKQRNGEWEDNIKLSFDQLSARYSDKPQRLQARQARVAR